MTENIFYHIEFLLTKHDCVIVPGLGGFIVNETLSYTNDKGQIRVPRHRISFTQELKHDDGILITHISQVYNLSYHTAAIELKKHISDLQSELNQENQISCARLGILYYDNNSLVFSANKRYAHPKLFGLKSFRLEKLTNIEKLATEERSHLSIRQIVSYAAATAAALLLIFAPTSQIKEQGNSNIQQAGFIHAISTNGNKAEIESQISFAEESILVNKITPSIETPRSLRSYYIIIGGDTSESVANRLLSKAQKDAFPDAEIVESKDRYRIYAAKFSNKSEAETYLESFRKEYPKYQSAWLFSQKN